MATKTAAKGAIRPGKEPTTTVYIPDLEVPVPTREDLLRAAYARALDDDERGDIRVKAAELCYKMLHDVEDSKPARMVTIIDDIPWEAPEEM